MLTAKTTSLNKNSFPASLPGLLFELAPQPYFVIDHRHILCEMNFTAADFLGVDRLKLRYVNFSTLFDSKYQELIRSHLTEVFNGLLGERHLLLVRVAAQGKRSFYIELNSVLVQMTSGERFCFCMWNDVTQRILLLQSLEHSKNQAEATTASKAEFFSNMSHEMRTPLTSIILYAQVAGREISSDKGKSYLDTIVRNARHLNTLIGDILDVAKIDADCIKVHVLETNILELFQDVVESLAPLALEKKIELRWTYDPKLPLLIKTDPVRLKQVLINIVGNAVKFTEKGSVTLDVKMQSPSFIQVLIRDTGRGIPAHQKGSLFQRFFQAENGSERGQRGTGLGLYLSRKLMQLLGGDVKLVSTSLGKGSVFSITVPIEK